MKKGYTLIELVMVLSIMSMMATLSVPAYMDLKQEGMATKAQKEIEVLQTAVEHYRQEYQKLPADLNAIQQDPNCRVLTRKAQDPWKTDGNNYGYKVGKTKDGKDYYIVFSKGMADKVDYQVKNNTVVNLEDNIIVSNLPVLEDL